MNIEKKYCLIVDNGRYLILELDSKKHSQVDNLADRKEFDSLYELFIYMFNYYNELSFYDIFKIFAFNNLQNSFNKCEFIKSYLANSRYFQGEEEVYMKIKIDKGSSYEILSILPKNLSLEKKIKGASLTLKIRKQYIPFYLSVFLKEYTIEDYQSTTKVLYGDENIISYLDLLNHNKDYYVVKNRDKVVYVSTSKGLAEYYVSLIKSIRKDDSSYFIPGIELVYGFKNLVNYLKMYYPDIETNTVKNIVDFTGTNNEVVSKDLCECFLNTVNNEKYVLKTESNDYILKRNMVEMFDFIVNKKIYEPKIIKISNLERNISARDIFKSIYLVNAIEDSEDLSKLNGISLLEGDNLIKIYSNLVNILLLEEEFSPVVSIVLKDDLYYDTLFFFNKCSRDIYLDSGNIRLLDTKDLSLSSIESIFLKKNLEIFMENYVDFDYEDVAVNLSSLYKRKQDYEKYPGIKLLKDIPCIIDVDSSLNKDVSSCGIVMRNSSNDILGKISRELNATTSVEAEIKGVMYAIKYAVMENLKEVCLRYDFVGVFEYLIDSPATEIAKEYQEFFKNVVNDNDIQIYFKKVKAHNLDAYNELADYLAGNLKKNDYLMK